MSGEVRYPWRYRCPDCGSSQVRKGSARCILTNREAAKARKFQMGAIVGHIGNVSYGIKTVPRYYCVVCKSHFDVPVDMLMPEKGAD